MEKGFFIVRSAYKNLIEGVSIQIESSGYV